MRTIIVTSCVLLCLTLASGQPLLAAPGTSVVEDGSLDAWYINFNVEPRRAPDYMDLRRGEISLHGGLFVFKFTMEGVVPDEPTLPPEGEVIVWAWGIDTDPATAPFGFPLSAGLAQPWEFDVFVLWDGLQFESILVDRRPLLHGEDAVVTPIPFDVEGNVVSASASRKMLDRPESFRWGGVTLVDPSFGGNSSEHFVDFFNPHGFWPAE